MELHKAIDRFIFRFNNHQTFKINDDDRFALNSILVYIDNSKKKYIKDNLLFAKMYVYTFNILFEYYKDLNIAQTQLHKEIDKSIVRLYGDFHTKVNDVEMELFLKNIGISNKHPFVSSEEDKKIELDILLSHSKELSEFINGRYSFNEVRERLNDQISEAINKYNK